MWVCMIYNENITLVACRIEIMIIDVISDFFGGDLLARQDSSQCICVSDVHLKRSGSAEL